MHQHKYIMLKKTYKTHHLLFLGVFPKISWTLLKFWNYTIQIPVDDVWCGLICRNIMRFSPNISAASQHKGDSEDGRHHVRKKATDLDTGTGGRPVWSMTARECRWSQEEVLQVPASVLTSGEYGLLPLPILAPTVKGHCSAHSESLWWAVLRKGTPLSLILCICAHGGVGGCIFGSDSEVLTVKHSSKPGPFPSSGNLCVKNCCVDYSTTHAYLSFMKYGKKKPAMRSYLLAFLGNLQNKGNRISFWNELLMLKKNKKNKKQRGSCGYVNAAWSHIVVNMIIPIKRRCSSAAD